MTTRDSVSTATTAVGVSLLSSAVGDAGKKSDPIRVGIIGPGGRGFNVHVKSLMKMRAGGGNVEITAVAEVYKQWRRFWPFGSGDVH